MESTETSAGLKKEEEGGEGGEGEAQLEWMSHGPRARPAEVPPQSTTLMAQIIKSSGQFKNRLYPVFD